MIRFINMCILFVSAISVALAQVDKDTVKQKSEAILLSDSIDLTKINPSDTLIKEELAPEYVSIKGKVYPVLIQDGDTMILANIQDISLTSPRTFDNPEDYRRYLKYKNYAAKVYPYAAEAIKIFRQQEYVTKNMKKRKRKKYLKQLQQNLKEEFEDPLKNLSKTQGKILVKMIERELETNMYDLIKGLRGRFRAFSWNQFSKLYGYRLKTGYIEGENPILDAVLQDLDISYEIDESDYEQFRN